MNSMELTVLSYRQKNPIFHKSEFFSALSKRPIKWQSTILQCSCSISSSNGDLMPNVAVSGSDSRRALVGCFLIAASGICVTDVASAVSTSRRALRGSKIPESEFKTLPNGLKYYDVKVGSGLEAVKGSRVAVQL